MTERQLYGTGKQSRSLANATEPEKLLLISDKLCPSLPKVRSIRCREIASNWIEAYKKYAGKSPPAPRVRETKPAPATSTASEVWVNTRSGKYWKPGSRFYGKTKEGEIMSELDALDRGYSPAGGTGQ